MAAATLGGGEDPNVAAERRWKDQARPSSHWNHTAVHMQAALSQVARQLFYSHFVNLSQMSPSQWHNHRPSKVLNMIFFPLRTLLESGMGIAHELAFVL